MDDMTLPFLTLAVLTLAGAMAAMTLRKLVHCALALAIAFVGLAGIYLGLGAQFVGLVQVMVYVGAVVILIVFAILLTRSDEPPSQRALLSWRAPWLAGFVVAAGVFAVLAWALTAGGMAQSSFSAPPQATIRQIGDALMQRFVLPFEIVGLLLTAALIGAVVIAMEEKQSAK
jgi:NADH:ubiquinone oxidoreductase subunit 6 (subunit J)